MDVTLLYVKLVLTAIFWGGTFIAGRVVSSQAEPITATFLRFSLASMALVFLARRRKGPLPRLTGRQAALILVLGLSGVVLYNLFFFGGLRTVPAGRASVIVAANPIFIFLGSVLFFRERLTGLRLAGIAFSFAGAALVISRGRPLAVFQGGVGWGELLILGCVASWVVYSLVGKVVMQDMLPRAAVTGACLAGTAGLLAPALLQTGPAGLARLSWTAWLGLAYLGFFGTALGFSWYYDGIRVLGPSRAAIFINLVPISAVVLGWLLLGETLDASLAAGAVLVVLGVYLINRSVERPLFRRQN
jgi:drug/metabolite transporter (DMT)-like permease